MAAQTLDWDAIGFERQRRFIPDGRFTASGQPREFEDHATDFSYFLRRSGASATPLSAPVRRVSCPCQCPDGWDCVEKLRFRA
ncbi:MAG: hypothetical protein GKR99_14595 [Rhodobacteraceae bacterium]|nr:hypothetical protein [Paracoccaceae bacterium]